MLELGPAVENGQELVLFLRRQGEDDAVDAEFLAQAQAAMPATLDLGHAVEEEIQPFLPSAVGPNPLEGGRYADAGTTPP